MSSDKALDVKLSTPKQLGGACPDSNAMCGNIDVTISVNAAEI
jgi:organic hydroperoxide reductase OsmC/OhrA